MRFSWWTPASHPSPNRQAGGCLKCGRCCESFGGHLSASRADLARWREAGRDDILAWVGASGWLWVDPSTGRLTDACPYLEVEGPDQATCAIQDLKPDICRDYPTLAHGRRCLRGGFLALAPAALAAADQVASLALAW